MFTLIVSGLPFQNPCLLSTSLTATKTNPRIATKDPADSTQHSTQRSNRITKDQAPDLHQAQMQLCHQAPPFAASKGPTVAQSTSLCSKQISNCGTKHLTCNKQRRNCVTKQLSLQQAKIQLSHRAAPLHSPITSPCSKQSSNCGTKQLPLQQAEMQKDAAESLSTSLAASEDETEPPSTSLNMQQAKMQLRHQAPHLQQAKAQLWHRAPPLQQAKIQLWHQAPHLQHAKMQLSHQEPPFAASKNETESPSISLCS